jgi:hypothetical protein
LHLWLLGQYYLQKLKRGIITALPQSKTIKKGIEKRIALKDLDTKESFPLPEKEEI